MTSFAEYDQFDGIGLAKLVRDGKISGIELCEEAIRRAEDLNPKLNAIITPLYDFAREAAKRSQPDAPFCGVPFLLKDAHHALKGFTLSSGSESLKGFVPQHGVQFIGRLGDEAKLLRLAAQLEKAQPWFDRKPQIVQ